ncbi:MAG TPA: RpoN/RPB10 RNA polymerase subunit family protein [Candidatus Saccharimonadales bacterium]|nr:RpoN/RPB10 RNA polymerase subunit family protein [Candidatus Saccharimonadales bacterium]
MEDTIKTYELPNICCIECNKPIAHLYDVYRQLKNINDDEHDHFNMLNVTRYCCRKELAKPEIKIINKANKDKILGITMIKPKSFSISSSISSSITPLVLSSDNICIQSKMERHCIPIYCEIGDGYKLTDDLNVHKVSKATYLAL